MQAAPGRETHCFSFRNDRDTELQRNPVTIAAIRRSTSQLLRRYSVLLTTLLKCP